MDEDASDYSFDPEGDEPEEMESESIPDTSLKTEEDLNIMMVNKSAKKKKAALLKEKEKEKEKEDDDKESEFKSEGSSDSFDDTLIGQHAN